MAVLGVVTQKVGMSRFVDEYGKMVAVTLLKVPSQQVTKILTEDKNGYQGYQVGFDEKKSEKKLTLADYYRLKKSGIEKFYKKFLEFRYYHHSSSLKDQKDKAQDSKLSLKLGQELSAADLTGVSYVDASGLTKGRGFQGCVKRWGFRISSMSHGSRYHRRSGSIGNCATPGRVAKGKKLPGRYGNARRTVKKLKVMVVDDKMNLIAVKGSVPGNKGCSIEIRPVAYESSDKKSSKS